MKTNTCSTNSNDTRSKSSCLLVALPQKNANSLAAPHLMNDAVISGYCKKRSNCMMSGICPYFFPKFKSEYFVLVGNYLFRYSCANSESPKGLPIPLDSVVSLSREKDCFTISTIWKVYTVKTISERECDMWIKCIRNRMADAIRERKGHASVKNSVRRINNAGATLYKTTLKSDCEGCPLLEMF
jgi:hypothetical protein